MVVCPDGSVGLLAEIRFPPRLCAVQFGASGPFRRFSLHRLRYASGNDIRDAGLLGVGCSQSDKGEV